MTKTMVTSTMPPPLLWQTRKRPETGGASAGIDTAIEYTYVEDELKRSSYEKDARSGPIGMGFRVPMIIASPWSRGGWVNSQLFDHTSTLMFLEHFVQTKYGNAVREENITRGAAPSPGTSHLCLPSFFCGGARDLFSKPGQIFGQHPAGPL